jgi:hypothetical protein
MPGPFISLEKMPCPFEILAETLKSAVDKIILSGLKLVIAHPRHIRRRIHQGEGNYSSMETSVYCLLLRIGFFCDRNYVFR